MGTYILIGCSGLYIALTIPLLAVRTPQWPRHTAIDLSSRCARLSRDYIPHECKNRIYTLYYDFRVTRLVNQSSCICFRAPLLHARPSFLCFMPLTCVTTCLQLALLTCLAPESCIASSYVA